MDFPISCLLLNWSHQEKSVDEVEEEARLKLKTRDEQISRLKEMLFNAFKERDEAHNNCRKLIFDKLLLQQKLQQKSGITSLVDDDGPTKENSFSDSDEQSIVSSSLKESKNMSIKVTKPLPENGKFLEAVVRAGPLLQTLLLSGTLPRWTRPPPPIDHREIPPPPPPVTVKKRGFLPEQQGCGHDYSCPELKYQRVVTQ